MSRLEEVIKSMEQKYKRGIIFSGKDIRKCEFIPFSSPRMNYVTRGGVAKSRLVEFIGMEGSGKTTSALDNLGNFQKIDDRGAVYVDLENTLDREWGEKLGVEWDKVIVLQPENESGEYILNMVEDFIMSGEIGWLCLDSIPHLVPKKVLEGSYDEGSFCGNSGILSKFANRITSKLAKYNCTAIMINQLRDRINSQFVAYNTPGGKALKCAYSQRIWFYKGKFIDKDNKEIPSSCEAPVGNLVDVKIEKNKVSKPDRRIGFYTLKYDTGIDIINDTVEVAILFNIIAQSGAWYYIIDEETGEVLNWDNELLKFQGKKRLLDKLNEDDELFSRIYKRVNEKLKE